MNVKNERNGTLFIMRLWAILVPCLFFSYVTDTVHMTILCLSTGLINFFYKSPVKITLRSVIYSIVLSLTVIVLTNTIFKIEGRFYLTPSEMGIPSALVFSMALLFFDDRPTFSASILILSIFSMMMCGDITNPHVFKNLPLPAALGKMEMIHLIYIISLCLCIFPFFYLMNRSHNKLSFTARSSYKLLLVKVLLVAGCLVMVFLLFRPTQNAVVPFTKNLESRMVRALSQWRFNKKKTAFQQHVDLRDSYFNMDEGAFDTILIRVETDTSPGYIRSRSYELYKDGVWGSNNKPAVMNLLQEQHEYSFNTYSFNGFEQVDKNSLKKMQIQYSGDFRVENILHQGKTRYIEMTCETLSQTDSGTVSGKALDFSGGVTLYNEKNRSPAECFNSPLLTEENSSEYLQTPDAVFKASLNRIVQAADELRPVSDDPKMFAYQIKRFFNDKYTYELGARLDRNKDPVFAFLEGPDRKGHCELFATTTVMLLRSQNIPARYITGFYCQEEHPNGKYFLGRSKDLHAWVEFYDKTTSSWYLLEPTPDSGMPAGSSNFNLLSSAWDSLAKRWKDLMSNIVRGYFAETVILFLKSILDLFIWCFSSIPKALISMFLLYLWYRRKRKKKQDHYVGKEIQVMQKDLQRLLNKLSKIKGLTIEPTMTLREITGKIESMNNPGLQPFCMCLKEYESIRYNASSRDNQSLNGIHKKINEVLKTRI